MTFFRSLFLNFITVFFVDRVIPGVEVSYFENVPNIGADFLFSLVVGTLNALVFPIFLILGINPNLFRMALLAFFFSFGPFIVIYFLHLGVIATNFEGVFVGGTIVWAISVLTNAIYKNQTYKPPEQ